MNRYRIFRFKIKNKLIFEFLGELIGSLILLTVGLCGVAQYRFQQNDNPYSTNYLLVNIGFGFGLILAILVTGKISGINNNKSVRFLEKF